MNILLENVDDLPEMNLKDLKVGDVLLSRGKCDTGKRFCISDLIVKLDGGDYSHAAFFDGEYFVQATTKGVQLSPPTILPEHQHYLHVYRFHDSNGKELDSPHLPSAELVNYARGLNNIDYGYDELVLVGILLLMRRGVGIRLFRDAMEVLGGIGLVALRKWFRKILGKGETIVCSELVSEVFWNPSDNKGVPYALPIEITKRHRLKLPSDDELPTPEQLLECEEFQKELEAVFEEAMPGFSQALTEHRAEEEKILSGAANGMTIPGGSKRLPSLCVSPCDLQRSPALRLVGNYIQHHV